MVCNQNIVFFAILFTLALRQVGFIQAYPQALIDINVNMTLAKWIETHHGS